MLVIVGAQSKKERDKHVNLALPVDMEYKKSHFLELLIYLREFYEYGSKISHKRGNKKI